VIATQETSVIVLALRIDTVAALLRTHSRGGALSLIVEIPFFFLLFISFWLLVEPKGDAQERSVRKISIPSIDPRRRWWVYCSRLSAKRRMVGGDETISRLESTPTEFSARTTGPQKCCASDFQATLNLIKDHRSWGLVRGYSRAITRVLGTLSGEWNLERAHNDYLELLASGGLIAAALVLWFW